MSDPAKVNSSSGPTFAMMCCANGAEQQVKQGMSEDGWRLAFSRPGFVTAKHDGVVDLPSGVFIRTASHSIGHLHNADGETQIAGLIDLLTANFPLGLRFDELHVWPRDRLPIGKFDFEPGIDEVSRLVAENIYQSLSVQWLACDAPNRIAEPESRVLDVVVVDPADWFVGWHTSRQWPSRWPGGVQPIQPQYEPISRAYFKAAESITWSGFEMMPGQTAVEIGSAPGGACGRLLELGLKVIGIDPAEMDPRIVQHPRFKHIKARAGDLPRREYRGAKWLLADSNVKPEKTLTTIDNIVNHRDCSLSGLLLTMKLGDYKAAHAIPHWIERIQRWNPQDIQVRQLARNRCEVCFAVKL
ncbi:SAM-dependent methyltransferase [Stieleria sp. TO1_6]|uniref:SAM-dependent methyltransferase n=1 Tax=Stieleria tagensis TaxID=2956795 RepID=UPI00209AF798|nr:SAM-dependent methyltransferase [Stieleria tagensis]MCO8120810.1 SAM-dependent methyltransferase [Stieleria tagensis]